MRKLFTVLLALAMTLALAVSAFAAGTTGSITITNPQGDHTYTAYKIFDVTYSGDNYSYTISDTDAAFPTVKAYADVAANGLKLTAVANTNKYNVSIGTEFSAASFAQHLKANVGSLGTGTEFTKDGNTMKASGLALGYYFVSGTSGSVCELTTAKDIQIRDKNEVPQIEKSVDDADGTVEVGQVLTYTINGKVPSTKGYTEFTYQVTDTMTEGLTFNKDVKVTIGGVDVTNDATITKNDNGFVARIRSTHLYSSPTLPPSTRTPSSAMRKPTPLRSSTATTPLTKTLLRKPAWKWKCSPSISSSTSTPPATRAPSWRAQSSC